MGEIWRTIGVEFKSWAESSDVIAMASALA
jgi:hypothetical protein